MSNAYMETTRLFTPLETVGTGTGRETVWKEDIITAIEISLLRGRKCLHKNPLLSCLLSILPECA